MVPPPKTRRSRDEDRRASRIHPLSPGGRLCARALGTSLWLSPRPRAPCERAGFRPARSRWRASLGAKVFQRLLQCVRCTGTYRGRIDSSYAAVRGDDPSPLWPSAAPSRGRHGLTSRARQASEEARVPGPGRPERRFALSFDGRVPSSNRTAHLLVVRALRRGAEPLSPFARTGFLAARERADASPLRSPVPHPPAKGDAFSRRPRCVPPPCAMA